MTREEEIIKQVEIYTNDVSNLAEWSDGWEDYNDYKYVKKAFINGAKWADKTMLEKACGYLHTHIDKDLVIYHEKSWKSLEQFINEFRKAMEE